MFSLPKASALSRPPDSRAIERVLVVDDSRAQCLLLARSLENWGFEVFQAQSGQQALEICQTEKIDLVLSDWMMPGMTGIEFCSALRNMGGERYVYFILLTSKTEKGAVAEGLEVGADDFLAKPVDAVELRARIKAGERVVAIERALRGNNTLLTDALEKLRGLYESLDRDLIEARSLQMSLVRERHQHCNHGEISLLLRPSGPVGGDMVGFFDIAPGYKGLYSLDVSGHGVTSALLTARLSGLLSGNSTEQNLAIAQGPDGNFGRDPGNVAKAMNTLMLSELETERYFTLAYAEIALETGHLRMVQAGHPHPMIQHRDGSVSMIGTGGMPIGLLDMADYTSFEAQLKPGERLLLMSDGITECPNSQGDELESEGLAKMLEKLKDMRGNALLDALMWELGRWHGSEEFPDDVSCALFEYTESA